MSEDSNRTIQGLGESHWLLKPQVHVHNIEKVIEKINCIVQGGKERLQVIFDFDMTITKHKENGVPTLSSFALLETLSPLPQEVLQEIHKKSKKYFSIEIDPNMTIEEKIPHMLEWWLLGIEVIKGLKMDPVEFEEFIKRNPLPFRDGTTESFKQLYNAGVPVLVFSAGIGDVVKMSLKVQNLLTSNVHVISNFLKFENGEVIGYAENIIHSFNKNEHLIENTPYFEELTGRTNAILLGDTIGDAKMADGVPHDTVLKIGFLNSKIEESLEKYLEWFDIVLADDQTMDILNHILKSTFI